VVAGWPPARRVRALLLDRDDTLVHDVPYNGDPARVEVCPGVRASLARARAAGLRLALVTNQSGVGLGLITAADVDAVNRRLQELVGFFDTTVVCPHHPDDACACRKPAPGMVVEAATRLGVRPDECVMVGDTLADVRAAEAAGASAILVPAPRTLPDEPAAVACSVATFSTAVDLVLEHA
jgi:histidinol-phosphate phosphatase family protein